MSAYSFSVKHLIINRDIIQEMPNVASRLGRCSKITWLQDPLSSTTLDCQDWSSSLFGCDRLTEVVLLIGGELSLGDTPDGVARPLGVAAQQVINCVAAQCLSFELVTVKPFLDTAS